MVTDRRIIVSNNRHAIDLSGQPYYVVSTEGFDTLDIQVVTSQGYGQVGATVVNSCILPRDMTINGQIYAETTDRMQDLKENLINLFLPTEKVTINHFYGGRNRIITAVVEKSPAFSFTKVTRILEYKVQLKAADPYWRDVTESLVQIANWKGGLRFPLHIPKKGTVFAVKQPSLIAVVYNKSNMMVGMRFSFIANGSVVNPQLFNINTRECFKLNCVMEPGEIITVQTGEDKTVTKRIKGVESDYIGKIDLAGGGNRFMELYPGDNLFRYSAESGEDMLEVKICFYNKYAGV